MQIIRELNRKQKPVGSGVWTLHFNFLRIMLPLSYPKIHLLFLIIKCKTGKKYANKPNLPFWRSVFLAFFLIFLNRTHCFKQEQSTRLPNITTLLFLVNKIQRKIFQYKACVSQRVSVTTKYNLLREYFSVFFLNFMHWSPNIYKMMHLQCQLWEFLKTVKIEI